ncbi:hypothetical protein JCM11251_006549 [Rhodosporidiobolus azoricus]
MADQPQLAAAALAPTAPSVHPLAADLPTPLPPDAPSAPPEANNGAAQEGGTQPSSFYVQAADEMCDAVLEHEAFLFSEQELAALKRWRGMDYQSRYLFMRLFLRKHGQWIRLSSLRNAYVSPRPSPSLKRSSSSSSSLFGGASIQPQPQCAETPAPDGGEPVSLLTESPAPILGDADGSEQQAEAPKRTWPADITDLDAACEDLWRTIALPHPQQPPPSTPSAAAEAVKQEVKSENGEEEHKPVAGPSSPRPRPSTPPPKPLATKSDNSVLDLTLTDSDEDGVLDLTVSPVRPPRPPPKSAKARGKQPALPPALPPSARAPPSLPKKANQDDLSRIAWSAEDLARDEEPEAVLGLLSMDELVALGRRMHVKVASGRSTRGDWTKALLKTSKQSTLSFFAAAATPKQQQASVGMKRSPSGSLAVGYDSKGKKLTQSTVVAKQALALIGPVIRLHPSYLILFQRLSLIYHRTSYTAVSTSALTSSLLARFGKRRYPTYTVSRSFSIFPSREVLLRFERAVETERQLEECLDGAWAAGLQLGKRKQGEKEGKEERLDRYRRGVEIWEGGGVEAEWRGLCEEAEREMKCQEDDEEKRLLYYRRRFHPGWPLSRAAYKAAGCYAKLGQHTREASILRHLLSQTSFRRGKRGDWYDRLALILMKYPGTTSSPSSSCSELSPVPAKGKAKVPKRKAKKEEGSEDEAMGEEGEKEKEKRERLQEALKLCQQGLDDPFTHLIYKSSLHRRIARLYSALSLGPPPSSLHIDLLAKPKQRTMEGERIDMPTIGKKSVWRLSDGAEGTVEELCLEHFHSENGVLTMIFALTFWDILFAPVDGVFETPYQAAPLDLATDAFAVVRRPQIAARLAAIAAGEAPSLLADVDDRERPLGTWAVGSNWERYSKEDLLEIVECFGGQALAAVLTVFAEEYGHRTGGIPDLCLWNPTLRRVLFAEVKGPGDTLSETQKVWLDVLLAASAASSAAAGEGGVDVEVVRVVTSREGAEESDEASDEDGDGDSRGKKRKRRKKGKNGGGGRARSRSKSVKVEEMEVSD